MEIPGLTSTKLAYLSGVFDGEGCVNITERIHKERGNDRPTFIPSLCVSNTDPNIVEAFRNAFGGSIKKSKVRSINHRQVYVWESKSAARLREIIPLLTEYTIGKTAALIQLKLLCDRMTGSTTPLTQGEINYRRKLKHNISKINHQTPQIRVSEPVLMSEVS